ncbi:MAG TPA: FliA/WhiG family RNA polymerase sigma factor [Granulicella sp.]|jgi:RNA polymerase sigma factor for flagellar operon FliA|nr:FliA/WhiG family RNA polymerase sigma factor [Granulicella sp.]
MSVGNVPPSRVAPGLPKRQTGGGEKDLSGVEHCKDLEKGKDLKLDDPELHDLALAASDAALDLDLDLDSDPALDPVLDPDSEPDLDASRMLAGLSAAEPGFAYPRLGMGEEVNSAAIPAPERDRLLLEHLPTVRYLARRIHERLPQHVELEDLISAGVVGLIDAFSKFDHTKKVQFKSYAQFRIRGAILDSLRTLDWSPRELRRKGRAVEEAIRATTQRLGRAPAEQEIALEMGLTLSEFQQLLGDLKGLEIGSLHIERTEDSGDQELAYIPGSPEEDPLFRCLRGEMKQRLADAIEDLPERERLVLTLYYYEELTMKEIGLTLGVVESRVSQIHSAAVLRLRVALAALRGAKGETGGKPGGRPRPNPGGTGNLGVPGIPRNPGNPVTSVRASLDRTPARTAF